MEKTKIQKVFSLLLQQWLLVAMGIACALAYCFPSVAKHGGIIRSQYSILYGVVGVMFLIGGLSIPHDKIGRQMQNWRLHLLVQGISFLLVPALMRAVIAIILRASASSASSTSSTSSASIDPSVLAGYTLTACIPTTIASNVVMTRAAGGDDAAALVEVLIANLLGPFITAPWTLVLLPHTSEFTTWRDGAGSSLTAMYASVFKQLGLSVLLPLVVGQFVRWKWPEQTERAVARFKLSKVASAGMALLVWTSFSSIFATNAIQKLSAASIVFTVLFNILLYLVLTAVCFFAADPLLSPEETIAVCFCGPAKSTALGIPLLYAMWAPLDLEIKAKTSIPVLLYTTEQICVANLLVHVFKRYRKKSG
ncbi:hypothetical protein ASPZODRAFT_128700 [Penicilliopsis zonata CBS 506.65]|uniref:Sodium bile acid symporter family protein n=1 Tax=Penicilliopsis zonata CBS 506.65 TaxID=1073090 RepID=A0A1L9SSJ0_9EURO|nr:hypothetical protein ASPZODRAFT_128700 [Penicilliopsis zonata CBS 506.65]OJJ50093.1 hypothetical protein ASPZODRAFT_128700 [Penicilliopsis zonata CBS 506.65]